MNDMLDSNIDDFADKDEIRLGFDDRFKRCSELAYDVTSDKSFFQPYFIFCGFPWLIATAEAIFCILSLTQNGRKLPPVVNSSILLTMILGGICMCIVVINLNGALVPEPWDGLGQASGSLGFAVITGTGHLGGVSARIQYLSLKGISILPRRELLLYFTGISIIILTGFAGFVGILLFVLGQADALFMHRVWLLAACLNCISLVPTSILGLLSLTWIKIKKLELAHRMLKFYWVVWTGILLGSCFAALTLIRTPYPLPTDECFTDIFRSAMPTIELYYSGTLRRSIPYLVGWTFVIWAYKKSREMKKLYNVEISRISKIVFYIAPIVVMVSCTFLPLSASTAAYIISMKVLVVIVCIVALFPAVMWNQPDTMDLEDWCCAGLLIFKESVITSGKTKARLLFFGPYILETGCFGFMLISLATTVVIPWEPESHIHQLDLYKHLNFDRDIIAFILRSLVGLCLLVYIIDTIGCCIVRLFSFSSKSPRLRRWLGYCHDFRTLYRFCLFCLGILPALRLALSGVECNPKTKTLNGFTMIICQSHWHKLIATVTYATVIWCMTLNGLTYARDFLFSVRPGLTQSPRVCVRNIFVRLVTVILMSMVSPQIMVGLGFFIVFALTILDVWNPSTWGFPIINLLQFVMMACVLEFHATALLNWAFPNSWPPVIITCVLLPLTGAISYYVGKHRFVHNPRDLQVNIRMERLMEIDYENVNTIISDHDLSVLLHTDAFKTHLWNTLSQESFKKLKCNQIIPFESKETNEDQNNHKLIGLERLEKALRVDCGLRALSFCKNFITTFPPFITHTDLSIQRTIIEICTHIINNGKLSADIRENCLESLIEIWGTNQCQILHNKIAYLLKEIKGTDRFILYSTTGNTKDTPYHTLFSTETSNGIFTITILSFNIWFIPIKNDENANAILFDINDPIDCLLSFPPYLDFSKNLFCECFNSVGILCIPTTTDQNIINESMIQLNKLQGITKVDESKKKRSTRITQILDKSRASLFNKQKNISDNTLKKKLIYILFYCKENDDYMLQLRDGFTQYYKGYLKPWQ